MRRSLFALAFVGLLACDGPTAPSLDFVNNRAKWERAHLRTYSFEYQRFCFCQPMERSRITVSNGQVSSVLLLSTGQPPDSASAALYDVTIDDLFDELSAALTHASHVTVTYDQPLGYPRAISIDYYANAVDDEVSHEAQLVP